MSLLSTMADAMRLVAHLCEDGLPESRQAVQIAQRALASAGYDSGPVDGIIGPRTRAAYARARADHMAYGALRIIRCDEEGGADLRAREDGGPHEGRTYYAPTSDPPQVVVWHWTAGQTTAHGLVGSFRRSRLSSHYAIDATGIYELLPPKFRGWHATWINRVAIGVDICQPVRAERLGEARDAGYDCKIMPNPSSRGERNCLSLDPRVAAKARWLAEYLSDTYNIPLITPVSSDVQWTSTRGLGAWSGHVGHHHVSASKWDIAPWMDYIFPRVRAVA